MTKKEITETIEQVKKRDDNIPKNGRGIAVQRRR